MIQSTCQPVLRTCTQLQPAARTCSSSSLQSPCRIYLEQLHSYELAEEYCDGVYEESQMTKLKRVQQLPASLQARLQGLGSPGGGIDTRAESGSDMYVLLIQVDLQAQSLLEPDAHNVVSGLEDHVMLSSHCHHVQAMHCCCRITDVA